MGPHHLRALAEPRVASRILAGLNYYRLRGVPRNNEFFAYKFTIGKLVHKSFVLFLEFTTFFLSLFFYPWKLLVAIIIKNGPLKKQGVSRLTGVTILFQKCPCTAHVNVLKHPSDLPPLKA